MSLMTLYVSAPPSMQDARPRRISVDQSGISIGRNTDNGCHLPDDSKVVSSTHAHIVYKLGRYLFIDDSTNGSYLNDSEESLARGAETTLNDGDTIGIGDYTLRASIQAEAPTPLIEAPPEEDSDTLMSPSTERNPALHAAVGFDAIAPAKTGSNKPFAAQSNNALIAAKLTFADMLIEALRFDSDNADALIANAGEIQAIIAALEELLPAVLKNRHSVKGETGGAQTQLGPANNNPLKFSFDKEYHLFQQRSGFMPPAEAVESALQETLHHEYGMLQGMRAAYQHMLDCLAPENIQRLAEANAQKNPKLASGKKALYWDAYQHYYAILKSDPEAAYNKLFGKAFANAYLRNLEQE